MTDVDAQQRILDYLNHMLDAIHLIQSYLQGLTKEEFIQDKRTQQAIILNLLTLGEAVSHIIRISPDFPELYPHLPWKSIRGMRNRMAHGYFDIDLNIVWDTTQLSLPELELKIKELHKAISNRQ